MASPFPAADEDLIKRLPLPLAHRYRRAFNAKTPKGRHLAAFYLWEAAIKLPVGTLAGETPGRYRLSRPIAKGGFGTVYDALDTRDADQKRVAPSQAKGSDPFWDGLSEVRPRNPGG